MQSVSRFLLTQEQVAKNPAIDPKVVKEAEQARRELEILGFWEESASRVRNPLEIKPDPRPHGQKIARLMIQSE